METLFLKSANDDLNLATAFCEPQNSDNQEVPKGIVQIVHGMCEHKERYYPFMEYLCSKGWVCVIHDHRGHGGSVRSAEDLGYMYDGGWDAMIEDIETVRKWSSEKWPSLKRVLLGHSMGSMAVRGYVKRYDSFVDTLIVCGSPSENPMAGAGRLLAKMTAAFSRKGWRHRPQILQKMSFGSFNRPFEDEGYPCAWVCSDKGTLEDYHADPLCQFVFTANGFYNLLGLMKYCYSPKGWAMKNPGMKVRFISGEKDPCRGSDRQHESSVRLMREVGYTDVDSRIFPGMRHEILNEADKALVWGYVLQEITE